MVFLTETSYEFDQKTSETLKQAQIRLMNWSSGCQWEAAISWHGTHGELTSAAILTLLSALATVLPGLRTSQLTVFDAGSGRGCLALQLAQHASIFAFKAVVGVEMEYALHCWAQQNCQHYPGVAAALLKMPFHSM